MKYGTMFVEVVVFLSVLLIGLSAVSSVFGAPALPESLRIKVLELRAAGNLSEADSLEKVFVAQQQLQTSKVQAQRQLGVAWNNAVQPMTIDKVWSWAQDTTVTDEIKQARILWLAKRYSLTVPDTTIPIPDQIADLETELTERAKFKAQFNALAGPALRKQNAQIAELRDELNGLLESKVQQVKELEELKAQLTTVTNRVDTVETDVVSLRDGLRRNTATTASLRDAISKHARYTDRADKRWEKVLPTTE